MKTKELKVRSTEELEKLYIEFCQKRQQLNFRVASRQQKNVRELRDAVKTIARILTILKEREIEKK
ncbi:50S ribosomal protein L29 [Candidatus Kuenenbacteria bacterium]|nr:50S ribosomal protein L29 [Candidatus Kuenenbacteria bacterium]